MKPRVRRRIVNGVLTGTLVAAVAWEVQARREALQSTSFLTGWLLLLTILFLALFQLRKKIPAPPLGRAAWWMQAHLYAGLASAPLAALHVPWRMPNGSLETGLATLYATTFVSGLIGLYWTRTLPRRMAASGEEMIYERAALLRSQIRERAAAAVLSLVQTSGDATLGEFYRRRLQPFLESAPRRRDRWSPSPRIRKQLLAELTDITRYLSDAERRTAEELFALIRKRDAVDYHEALQWRLKAWLCVHIALTWPLVLMAVVHAWLAHLFAGTLAVLPMWERIL